MNEGRLSRQAGQSGSATLSAIDEVCRLSASAGVPEQEHCIGQQCM